jgi:hypothetical protein
VNGFHGNPLYLWLLSDGFLSIYRFCAWFAWEFSVYVVTL